MFLSKEKGFLITSEVWMFLFTLDVGVPVLFEGVGILHFRGVVFLFTLEL